MTRNLRLDILVSFLASVSASLGAGLFYFFFNTYGVLCPWYFFAYVYNCIFFLGYTYMGGEL